MIVPSHVQLRPALQSRRDGRAQTEFSLDLGLSTTHVRLIGRGVTSPDGGMLSWEDAHTIADDEQHCFVVDDGNPRL